MKTRQLLCAAAFTAALTFSACNCGGGTGNGNGNGNGNTDGGDPPPGATFSAYVIDLINNQTNETSAPADLSFDTADSEDPATYDVLFQ